MQYHKIHLWTIAATILVGVWGCKGNDNPAGAPSNTAYDESIPVETALVRTKTMSLPIYASGMVNSSSEQKLSFKIGGVVRKIYVEEGDLVRPGQLLAVLDKTEIDAQVEQARQAVSKSERDLARVESLYSDSSATLELLQNATTGRDMVREGAKIAVFNQQYAEIRASRAGKIIKKLSNEGEITGPGMPVFVLFETGANDWIVRVNVSDRDWARVKIGASAKIHLDAYPHTDFKGSVSKIAPAADPSNGLYPLEIRINTQSQRMAPGLFAKVELQASQAKSYALIPIEAIMEGDGQSAWVFSLDDDGSSVHKTPIQIAFIDGTDVVVSAGLESVREVVTKGAPYLTEKKKVNKIN